MVNKRTFSSTESDFRLNPDISRVGAKAVGLLAVPAAWVPPFVVCCWSADPFREDEIAAVVDALADHPARTYAVRSSETVEDLALRGQLDSKLDVGRAELFKAVVDIASQGSETNRRVIIQPMLQVVVRGHLSNETRLSERNNLWHWEIEPGGEKRTFITPATKATIVEDPSPLTVSLVANLEHGLRKISTLAIARSNRVHFEWVWDGSRLWVVQADVEPVVFGEVGTAFRELPAVNKGHSAGGLAELDLATSPWRKVQCLGAFKRAGLEIGRLWILEDFGKISFLGSTASCPDWLKSDIEGLGVLPLVVRTESSRGRLLLPRSDCCMSVESVFRFLRTTVSTMKQQSVQADSYCFLFHRFIPARASAYAYAVPDDPVVQIDTTWGVPETLQYYSHDSSRVNLANGAEVWTKKRAKTSLIDVEADGSWQEKRVPTRLVWSPSATENDLAEIAVGTKAIAAEMGYPVEVMWFVDVADNAGYPKLLPWFARERTEFVEPEALYRSSIADLIRVSNRAELEAIRASPPRMFEVRPDIDHLREPLFLEEVGIFAKENKLVVVMVGSCLSHAYYMLRSAGVYVEVVDYARVPEGFSGRSFNKLVRDGVPEWIQSKGESVVASTLLTYSRESALFDKLLEEVGELLVAEGSDDRLTEASDVFEVLLGILHLNELSESDLITSASKKRGERGGFDHGVVLESTNVARTIHDENEPLFQERSRATSKGVQMSPVRLLLMGKSLDVDPDDQAYRVTIRFDDGKLSAAIKPVAQERRPPRPPQLSLLDLLDE